MSTLYGKKIDKILSENEKCNIELLTLLYGSFVVQVVEEFKHTDLINKKLFLLGFEAGSKLIDDFLSKTDLMKCGNFQEVCNCTALIGLRVYAGIEAEVEIKAEDKAHIKFIVDPLGNNVEIPEELSNLNYYEYLCGAIVGSLKQLGINCQVEVLKDALKGDEFTILEMNFCQEENNAFVDL